MHGNPSWNVASKAKPTCIDTGELQSLMQRFTPRCHQACGVMVGSTAPMRPPNHAAIAPKIRAIAPNSAPREVAVAAVSAAALRLLFGLLDHLPVLLLVLVPPARPRLVDRRRFAISRSPAQRVHGRLAPAEGHLSAQPAPQTRRHPSALPHQFRRWHPASTVQFRRMGRPHGRARALPLERRSAPSSRASGRSPTPLCPTSGKHPLRSPRSSWSGDRTRPASSEPRLSGHARLRRIPWLTSQAAGGIAAQQEQR